MTEVPTTEPLFIPALWLDGETAAVHEVLLILEDDANGILILEGKTERDAWPYADLRIVPDVAGPDQMILSVQGEETARLIVSAHDAGLIRARAANLRRRPPLRQKGKLAAWALAAVGSVALIIFGLVPLMANQLAAFLPPAGEKALGDATLTQIRQALDETGYGELPLCETTDGLAALRTIEARLTANADLPIEITVQVLDHEMVNAFALPGGYIVVFRGLLEKAESPEEVAAVLAHEMGHVSARDPSRIALRSAGSIGVLGLLFGDFAGGAMVLFITNRIIQADYTREAEANADLYAHDLLRRSDLPPSAIATFFERLRAEGNEDDTSILRHFMSHPALGDRIAAARAATPEGQVTVPLLEPAEWKALKYICD